MTIRKKLFTNFGMILGIMFILFAVNMLAILREHSAKEAAKQSTELASAVEKVRFQVMQNRVTLSSYLLSGSPKDVETLHAGIGKLGDQLRDAQGKAQTVEQKDRLSRLEKLERDWDSEFATKMIDKRKEVDSGNATVADLQIAYLNADPEKRIKSSTELLEEVDRANRSELDAHNASDATAANLDACSFDPWNHSGAGRRRIHRPPHLFIDHRSPLTPHRCRSRNRRLRRSRPHY